MNFINKLFKKSKPLSKKIFFKGNTRDTDLEIIKYISEKDLFSLLKVNKYLYNLIINADDLWKHTLLFKNELFYKPKDIKYREFYMDLNGIVLYCKKMRCEDLEINTLAVKINKFEKLERNNSFDILIDMLMLIDNEISGSCYKYSCHEIKEFAECHKIDEFLNKNYEIYIKYINNKISKPLEFILVRSLAYRKRKQCKYY